MAFPSFQDWLRADVHAKLLAGGDPEVLASTCVDFGMVNPLDFPPRYFSPAFRDALRRHAAIAGRRRSATPA
jgi:hypothetical protein